MAQIPKAFIGNPTFEIHPQGANPTSGRRGRIATVERGVKPAHYWGLSPTGEKNPLMIATAGGAGLGYPLCESLLLLMKKQCCNLYGL
ncbi:hypothetical protein EVAR_47380_1 [Eumeta japonica]|uniref:Uncharacterized protein n=1 Tax=Eumeta variegata TaxID=151549 RepID=A0A4C1WT14_EUMVA|nr:hypothetical protein EVAR_47380_1 [Eumeta japonica]